MDKKRTIKQQEQWIEYLKNWIEYLKNSIDDYSEDLREAQEELKEMLATTPQAPSQTAAGDPSKAQEKAF